MTSMTTVRSGSQPRGRRWPWIVVPALIVLLALGGELLARSLTGEIAERELLERLPAESGIQLDVRATGKCILCELLGGELSGLDVDGERVRLGGAIGLLSMHVEDVGLTKPVSIGTASGVLRVNEQEFNTLLTEAASRADLRIDDIELRDDRLAYRAATDIRGIEIALDVTASVRLADDGRVRFSAEELAVVSGPFQAGIPVDLSRMSFDMCVARHLPQVLAITSIEILDDAFEIGFTSTRQFTAEGGTFRDLGNC